VGEEEDGERRLGDKKKKAGGRGAASLVEIEF